jgi:hypothetical protein
MSPSSTPWASSVVRALGTQRRQHSSASRRATCGHSASPAFERVIWALSVAELEPKLNPSTCEKTEHPSGSNLINFAINIASLPIRYTGQGENRQIFGNKDTCVKARHHT